jgi:hypothetical protein
MWVARWGALLMLFAMLVGWPLGSALAWMQQTGGDLWTWLRAGNYFNAFDSGLILLTVFFPLMTLLCGYLVSRFQEMVGAAEDIADTARQFIHPDEAAADNARSVGLVVREQMDALNVGLDGALNRLASVEAMIRKHVVAIEAAGETVETRATGAVARVAEERVRLIELTENLNTQADHFAKAIAEKARASVEALHLSGDAADRAERDLEERLGRLDVAARHALDSFNALSDALAGAQDSVKGVAGSIDVAAGEARAASERAQKIAETAAETTARNIANVGASAQRAAEDAKRHAEAAIETAQREAERASLSAYEAAEREAQRVADVASKVLGEVRKSTSDLIGSVSADTDKAVTFAARMSDAAKLSVEAAHKATAELVRAGEDAKRQAEETLAAAEAAAQRTEARNKSLFEARAALEAENARLETLIEEQRQRADRLADAIASQTERLSKLAEAQLREQEAVARLSVQQNLKRQEEEAQRAVALAERRRLEEAAAAAKADAERLQREERERLAQEAAAAKAEAERLAREKEDIERARADAAAAKAAEAEKPTLVERAMKAKGKDNEGVLDLGKASEHGARRQGKYRAGANGAARNAGRLEPTLTEDEAQAQPRDKQNVSWREILEATDEAEPLDLAAAEAAEADTDSMRIIGDLQRFTLDLETRLYGEPPAALKERFERGDRNVFANRILRLNEADVKRRIRMEADRDRAFDSDIQGFLQGFERLLEDATTSRTADEDLEEYLSSPLGRVYLLIGAMVGYFA